MSSDLRHRPTTSVVVATSGSAEVLTRCLARLACQTTTPDEVLVVDSSSDDHHEIVARSLPTATYLRAGQDGAGRARALGLAASTGEVIAFTDASCTAEPSWLAALLAPYDDAPDVAGTGGRIVTDLPRSPDRDWGQIGMLLPNGRLTESFDHDPGRDVDVDHLPASNMSLRRAALDDLGAIPDLYRGRGRHADVAPALRLVSAGWRLRFTPAAIVRWLGAAGPEARATPRDRFLDSRDQMVMLAATGHRDRLAPFVRSTLGAARRDVRTRVGSAVRREIPPYAATRQVADGIVDGAVAAAGLACGWWQTATGSTGSAR